MSKDQLNWCGLLIIRLKTKTVEKTYWAIKNYKSRDTGNTDRRQTKHTAQKT